MIDLSTGKQMTRGGFIKGILASGIAPSITLATIANSGTANATVGGMMRNVGARNAAMWGGSGPTAKDYICNLYLFDGIENNGYGKHSDSITTWRDNNGHGVYIGKSWDSFVVGNSFKISSYTTSNGQQISGKDSGVTFDPLNGDLTLETVFLPFLTQQIGLGIIFSGDEWGFISTPYNGRLRLQFDGTNNWVYTSLSTISKTMYMAIVRKNGKIYAYLNGILVSNGTVSSSKTGATGIHGDRISSFYQIRISNYALEQADITHNYNLDKLRFGLE